MEVSPLSIILVKSDSKGDRLLFRYPFSSDSKPVHDKKFSKKNPYALVISEDLLQSSPVTTNVVKGTLTGLTDELLSKLFAVKPELYERKFELKVNDVRFVGHPTLYHSITSDRSERNAGKNQKQNGNSALHLDTPSTILINTVFALHSFASHSVVKCYYDLSKRIGAALKHEEKRCFYVTKQTKEMIMAHDEVAQRLADTSGSNCESPFELILKRSSLAADLKKVFDDLCHNGLVHVRINRWIEVSFCLPHKVHQTAFTKKGCIMEPDLIDKCLESIRPYHGLLLLTDSRELFESTPPDSSPALLRLLQVYSPLKSFQTLAADADITLTHIFQLTGHLVYWAQAMVIYPICENNLYAVAPESLICVDSPLIEKFSEKFPGQNLLQLMSDFSVPTTLSQKLTPLTPHSEQRQLIHIIAWMLQHRLLVQLHTYVYLMLDTENYSVSENKQSFSNLSNKTIKYDKASNTSNINYEIAIDLHEEKNVISNYLTDICSSSLEIDKKNIIEKILLDNFNEDERQSILKIPATLNVDDFFWLITLYDKGYLNGKHHLEEIMFSLNIKRSTLLQILDKFRDILVTCEMEDPALNVFYAFAQ